MSLFCERDVANTSCASPSGHRTPASDEPRCAAPNVASGPASQLRTPALLDESHALASALSLPLARCVIELVAMELSALPLSAMVGSVKSALWGCVASGAYGTAAAQPTSGASATADWKLRLPVPRLARLGCTTLSALPTRQHS